MFTNVRNKLMWQVHALTTNEWRVFLERHIYSRSRGRNIMMRFTYSHKHIKSEGCGLRHRWCGLGFRHDDRINLFQGIRYPNIHWYGMSMVGWLCFDHYLEGGRVERVLLSNLFILFLLYFGILISNNLLTWRERSRMQKIHVAWANKMIN